MSTLTDIEVEIAAIFTGLAGMVSATGGVLLAIRAVRSKERKAAAAELDQVSTELSKERAARLQAERRQHDYHVLLVKNGLDPDEPE